MDLIERVQRFLKKRGDGCVPVERSPAMKALEKLDPALQKFLCSHSRLVFLDKSRGRLLPGPGPIEKRGFRVVENRSRPSSFQQHRFLLVSGGLMCEAGSSFEISNDEGVWLSAF